jgi:ribosomal protein S27AE
MSNKRELAERLEQVKGKVRAQREKEDRFCPRAGRHLLAEHSL